MVYNPVYDGTPFTAFEQVGPDTDLSSLNLNWREADLSERERTKHVHRLHPYLGKFIPQLVEIFLRKFQPKRVVDPFCGSGTTLVEATVLGVPSFGTDISAFNCLLSRVKTGKYDVAALEKEVKDILLKTKLATRKTLFSEEDVDVLTDNEYLKEWFAPKALAELITYRSFIDNYKYSNVLKIILSRSARSARLTTHFDLDFPKRPIREPYYCYKHGRTCEPTKDAYKFIYRYSLDTIKRIKEYSLIRRDVEAEIVHGDAREVRYPNCDLVLTSPPYIGLIDYHEQHRYAFELLGLDNKEAAEIGAAKNGRSKNAKEKYVENICLTFSNILTSTVAGGHIVIVANDTEGLYPIIKEKLGVKEIANIKRHVNRRTGRRANDFFENVFVWRV